jgi:uncharacterized protein YbaA (DUF1428 family)
MKMAYVDGFLVPVPRDKLDAYLEMSRTCGPIWLEFGATRFVECVADDVKTGQWTSFPQAVKLEENEVVVFSWIEYPSREDRDRINELVMKDPRFDPYMKPENMPFDGKRMMFGGFKPMVEL